MSIYLFSVENLMAHVKSDYCCVSRKISRTSRIGFEFIPARRVKKIRNQTFQPESFVIRDSFSITFFFFIPFRDLKSSSFGWLGGRSDRLASFFPRASLDRLIKVTPNKMLYAVFESSPFAILSSTSGGRGREEAFRGWRGGCRRELDDTQDGQTGRDDGERTRDAEEGTPGAGSSGAKAKTAEWNYSCSIVYNGRINGLNRRHAARSLFVTRAERRARQKSRAESRHRKWQSETRIVIGDENGASRFLYHLCISTRVGIWSYNKLQRKLKHERTQLICHAIVLFAPKCAEKLLKGSEKYLLTT